MTATISRRFALFRIGSAAAAAATVATIKPAAATVTPQDDLTPFTPTQYIDAQVARGWTVAAGFYYRKDGGIKKMMVIERMPENYWQGTAAEVLRRHHEHNLIGLRVGSPHLFDAVWAILWERGFRENVCPHMPNGQSSRQAVQS